MKKNYLKIARCFIQTPINELLLKKYFNQGVVTFFNWEFFDQQATITKGLPVFGFDYNIQQTKTFTRLEKEREFFNILLDSKINFTYWKIIPDEEIPFMWPETFLRIGPDKLRRQVKSFQKRAQKYISKNLSPDIRVALLSDLVKDFDLGETYEKAYLEVVTSFDTKYISTVVPSSVFLEDFEFRQTHYTKKPVLPEKLIKDYSVKMFAVFAAETSCLFALQKLGILPNLVLISNESARAIKKYETLQETEKRPILPKLFVI